MSAKFAAAMLAAASSCLLAANGRDAWLAYPAPTGATPATPAAIVALGDSPVISNARSEVTRAVHGVTGRTLRIEASLPKESAIVLGKLDDLRAAGLALTGKLADDGYQIAPVRNHIVIAGANERGVLYGAFAFGRRLAAGQPLAEKSEPYANVRWINQWDNLDGTIERGYGGRSIFWDNGHVRADLSRVSEYGRLLASIGINACSISNVNADRRLMSAEYAPEIARIAEAFRPWGVRVALSVDFGSPKSIGGMDTFDPLDERVAAWWKQRVDALYEAVPDLAGIVIKADSEGRVGPSAYGRTHADAANVVARAVAPHGGLLFYRGFVYDHHMDWRNLKNDRARAAWDNFHDLDGKFDANVIIQIKHGPIDFQVREPASPLFGALEKSNQAIELQVTQEYFGQARYTVYLAPMWKEVLDFDMHAKGAGTPVKALVSGRTFARPAGGFVGVSNVGLDDNWLGNHLSQANLYAFGRLAWNPDLTPAAIIDEWTRLTFNSDPMVIKTVNEVQLSSWQAFEKHTGVLGLQTLTDIVGNHYGVAVEASERNGWGQWHRSDEKGLGMDRTVATGTGFIGQYRPPVAKMYENKQTCPDNLLVFMHHVPYTYRLHSGKTVIQYIYDAHYEGAARVAAYAGEWKRLKGRIDDERYHAVLAQLVYQASQAEVWRDAVNNWYAKTSGIADAQGRVGKHAGRIEAEALQLDGYAPVDVKPWETASDGKAITCAGERCTASWKFDGAAGWYTLRVQYFDQINGISRFRVLVGSQLVDAWSANDCIPTRTLDGSSSSLRLIRGIALRPGDQITMEGIPDAGERAGLDFIEIVREQ